MASQAVVPGSLAAVAQQDGSSLAEVFLGCEIVAIVDTSSSMDTYDARGGRQRYQVACDELSRLQAAHPGKVGVISFSSQAMFCPNGIPYYYGNGTDLAGALKFARVVDGVVRFVVISDGEPQNEGRALAEAATMQSEISAIFVGPEGGSGADFLARLAKHKGGQFATATAGDLLKDRVEAVMMLGAGR